MESVGLVYNPELAKINKVSEEIAKILGQEDEYKRQRYRSKIEALTRFDGS
jgi:lantibiotic modifying enzyme